MNNKSWKVVYIRVQNGYDKKGRLKYKWEPIGRLHGHGRVDKKWDVVLYNDEQ